ncbi:MAG: FG-GAP-like repeat-containing protein [Bacteroidota bacterium]
MPKIRHLFLAGFLLMAGTEFAWPQIDVFARVAAIPVPAIENAGFGNFVAGVDFDGDGRLEIYAVNHNWSDTGAELIPRIYKFEFTGTTWDSVWSATLPIPLQNTWPALTYGDWDGDGKMEVIWSPVNFTNAVSNPNPARIVVFEEVGDGSDHMGVSDGAGGWRANAQWTIVSTASFNLRPFRSVLTDVDNDGAKELVFCDRASSTTGYRFGVVGVSTIPDNGDSSETWTLEYSGKDSTLATGTIYDVAVVDSTIYLFHSTATGPITPVKYANGTWTIGKAQTGLVPQSSWKSAQVVDVDGNGTKEIVVGSGSPSGANNKVYLLQQSGDTLVSTQIADFAPFIGGGSARLFGGASGDIDNDSRPDFVFGTRNATPPASFVRLRYIGGAITSPASYELSRIDDSKDATGAGRWDMVAIASLDADADAEVLVSNGVDNLRTPLIVLDRLLLPYTNLMSIAEARIDANADFRPDRLAERVTVVGVVNSINPTASANQFSYYIQEGNAGINITRGSVTGGGPVYNLGDRVVVNGVVSQDRGTTQLALDSLGAVVRLATGVALTPLTVTIGSYLASPETFEGRLIKINYVAKAATSVAWPGSGADANMTITDGWQTFLMRIDLDTDIDGQTEPTYPMNVTGVATQFTSSVSVYDDGYQISPNFYTDFVQGVAAPPERHFSLLAPSNASQVVLNDTAQVVLFNWHAAVDLNGDTLTYAWVVVGKGPIATGNGGRDTMITRTGKQMRDTYLLGSDTVTIRWTALAKDVANPAVACIDTFSLTVIRGTITGVADVGTLPTVYTLQQNYPNPFNPSTTIDYDLPAASNVTLTIYDILGREVATLVNEMKGAGRYSMRWDGRTQHGLPVASGVYFYRIEARPVDGGNAFVVSKKMMMMK